MVTAIPDDDVSIDPEFQAMGSALAPIELRLLEESLKKEGCRDDLVVWRHLRLLLDGHNRYCFCWRHGIPYKIKLIDLPDRDSAKAWILKTQLGRRNLTDFRRAEVALQLAELDSAYATMLKSSRMREKNAGKSLPLDKLGNSVKIDTLGTAAKHAKLSRATVHKAKVIAEKAPEETKKRLRSGEAKIDPVYREVTGKPKRAAGRMPTPQFDEEVFEFFQGTASVADRDQVLTADEIALINQRQFRKIPTERRLLLIGFIAGYCVDGERPVPKAIKTKMGITG